MSDIGYIEGLEIARDERLRALRPAQETVMGGIRRGPAGPGSEAQGLARAADAIDDGLRAAVNAGSLVSFVGGVTIDEKADVLFSMQLAQRAASARHDRFAETQAWYRSYVEVLERLGWVGDQFAFTYRGKSKGDFRMDKSALDIIMAVATSNQLAVLVKTLDTLKGLADSDGAVRIFALQAMAELSGNFQIGAAQKAENGVISLALGAFQFIATDSRSRFLVVSWGAEEVEFWTAAQKMNFNAEHYAGVRKAVEMKLSDDALDYIAGLEI